MVRLKIALFCENMAWNDSYSRVKCDLLSIALMMEPASTSEMSENFYQTTWHNSEDRHLLICILPPCPCNLYRNVSLASLYNTLFRTHKELGVDRQIDNTISGNENITFSLCLINFTLLSRFHHLLLLLT
jgi:hypothetical protein